MASVGHLSVGLQCCLQQLAELADRSDRPPTALARDPRPIVGPFRNVKGKRAAFLTTRSRVVEFHEVVSDQCRLSLHMLRSLRTDSQTDSNKDNLRLALVYLRQRDGALRCRNVRMRRERSFTRRRVPCRWRFHAPDPRHEFLTSRLRRRHAARVPRGASLGG